jgi:drug/metabolite transporter (DMT)-like permease
VSAFLALLSSLCWGSADFLGGLATRRLPSIVVVWISQIFGLVLISAIVLATGSWHAPPQYWPWALLASVSGAVGLISFYRALATGSMGVVAPIAGLGGLIPLAAGLASGERFSQLAAVGAIAILAGVIFASGPELNAEGGRRPLLLAVAAAVLFGISLLAIARGSAHSTLMTIAGMRIFSVAIIGFGLLLARKSVVAPRPEVRRLLPLMAAGGVLDVSANLTYGASSTTGLLVVVAVLGSLYPVVTAVLAAIVLHERLRRIQYAGVALAVVGLALLSVGQS